MKKVVIKTARPSSKETVGVAVISKGIFRSLTTARAKMLKAVEAFIPNSLHRLSN